MELNSNMSLQKCLRSTQGLLRITKGPCGVFSRTGGSRSLAWSCIFRHHQASSESVSVCVCVCVRLCFRAFLTLTLNVLRHPDRSVALSTARSDSGAFRPAELPNVLDVTSITTHLLIWGLSHPCTSCMFHDLNALKISGAVAPPLDYACCMITIH